MSSSIRIQTLTDGGQPASEVAGEVAGFIGAAKRSLDLAQYDFNLGPETRELVGGAIREAQARGVAVRILYNVDHANPIPVPPPPEPDVQLIASLGVPARAIAGVPDLMHHKYVARDGEALWTGSTNWTDDSWSRQENVVVTVASEALARAFTLNFEELWQGATSSTAASSSRDRSTWTGYACGRGSRQASLTR
jgi:phosphatidylserine/phosphatidylglycerophosphate/cardiolipin synthase-like enzyme